MSDRRASSVRLVPAALLLLVAIGLAAGEAGGGLSLASPNEDAAEDFVRVLDGLPDEPTVLVAFDPDLGTYAEIRPTVRAVLGDLLDRGATVAVISVTPEGRALALAEIDRLERVEAPAERVIDVGFLPGAEAAVVAVASALQAEAPRGLATELRETLDERTVPLLVVVGGNDFGPRPWVEQLLPRTEGIRLVAVAPTALLPELRPYRASDQLDALLGTPRDGATYRASVELGRAAGAASEVERPLALAVLIGGVAAAGWLLVGLGTRFAAAWRSGGAP